MQYATILRTRSAANLNDLGPTQEHFVGRIGTATTTTGNGGEHSLFGTQAGGGEPRQAGPRGQGENGPSMMLVRFHRQGRRRQRQFLGVGGCCDCLGVGVGHSNVGSLLLLVVLFLRGDARHEQKEQRGGERLFGDERGEHHRFCCCILCCCLDWERRKGNEQQHQQL